MKRMLVLVIAFAAALMPAPVLAASPSFSTPSVSANLGEPVTFTSEIQGDDIAGVDVLVRLQGYDTNVVLHADPGHAPYALCRCWDGRVDVRAAIPIRRRTCAVRSIPPC